MGGSDQFSAEKRSSIMSSVGSKDTEPEVVLRKHLWHNGLRYRIHESIADTKPDLVFRGAQIAVFVDGCFWHGCPEHYSEPESNKDLWREKLERNQARDRRDDRKLTEAGWTVIRVWECEVRNELEEAAGRIERAVREA